MTKSASQSERCSSDLCDFVNQGTDMYLEELPESVIFAMSETQWLVAAWNAAVEGVAKGKTRVVSSRRGRWVVACTNAHDIAILTKNNDVLYKLRRIDSLRKLPYVRVVCPVPDAVTSSQARAHGDLNDVFQSSGRSTAHPNIPAVTLDVLRRLPLKSMPLNLWQALAWKIAVGPEFSHRTQVRAVVEGSWIIVCDSAKTQSEIESTEAIALALRWLSRYRECEVRSIKAIAACPSGR